MPSGAPVAQTGPKEGIALLFPGNRISKPARVSTAAAGKRPSIPKKERSWRKARSLRTARAELAVEYGIARPGVRSCTSRMVLTRLPFTRQAGPSAARNAPEHRAGKRSATSRTTSTAGGCADALQRCSLTRQGFRHVALSNHPAASHLRLTTVTGFSEQ
jgi:hypothetical protein